MAIQAGASAGLWNRNRTKIILITLLIATFILLIVMGIMRLMPGSNDIRASISTHVFSTTDSVFYKDVSEFAKDHRWNFLDTSEHSARLDYSFFL